MLVLALDTATPASTAALVEVTADGLFGVAERRTVDPRAHGERLAPEIAATLADAGVRPRDLTAIVVGAGPGPFTGLRVGLATAASMGQALGVPTYGVCSLDALGRAAGPGRVLVATDARRREVYFATYLDGERVFGPEVARPADVAALLARAAEQADLTTAQAAALAAGLTEEQVADMTEVQAAALTAGLTTAQVAVLTTGLTATQPVAPRSGVAAARAAALVAGLTPEQAAGLTARQVADLTASRTAARMAGQTAEQVAELTASQAVALSSGLTAEQVAELTAAQTAARAARGPGGLPEQPGGVTLAGLVDRAAGEGALKYGDVFGVPVEEHLLHPPGAALVAIAAARIRSAAPSEALTPLYLRRPDAVEPAARKPVLT